MIFKDDIIFEPTNTPNKNWVKDLDSRHMDSSLSSFKAPKNDNRVITLCKPFVVFSKNSYSSPVTLPLGLAYLGGVLEKAGYKIKRETYYLLLVFLNFRSILKLDLLNIKKNFPFLKSIKSKMFKIYCP